MSYRSEYLEYTYGRAGYSDTPARVPFVELVAPFTYVGEEVVRLGSAVTSMMSRVIGSVMRWSNERSTIKALQALDDFRLADIGVRREQIREIARNLAHG